MLRVVPSVVFRARAPAPFSLVSYLKPHARLLSTGTDKRSIAHLLEQNKKWAAAKVEADPEFFSRLANQQAPKYLWIGCSDSRVPANQILGLAPGEVFVHRNVANLVVNTDMNFLSVLQYAVEILQVEHILVTGHYNCGGVLTAMKHQSLGLIDNWLRNIRDVARLHQAELKAIKDEKKRADRLVELNVLEQCVNVFKTAVVQKRQMENPDRFPKVHALVYSLEEGILKELKLDEKAMFRNYASVYSLFDAPPAAPVLPPQAPADAGKHGPGCTCPSHAK